MTYTDLNVVLSAVSGQTAEGVSTQASKLLAALTGEQASFDLGSSGYTRAIMKTGAGSAVRPYTRAHKGGRSQTKTCPITQSRSDINGSQYYLTHDNGSTYMSGHSLTIRHFIPANYMINQIGNVVTESRLIIDFTSSGVTTTCRLYNGSNELTSVTVANATYAVMWGDDSPCTSATATSTASGVRKFPDDIWMLDGVTITNAILWSSTQSYYVMTCGNSSYTASQGGNADNRPISAWNSPTTEVLGFDSDVEVPDGFLYGYVQGVVYTTGSNEDWWTIGEPLKMQVCLL